jgi:hypothetical protein
MKKVVFRSSGGPGWVPCSKALEQEQERIALGCWAGSQSGYQDRGQNGPRAVEGTAGPWHCLRATRVKGAVGLQLFSFQLPIRLHARSGDRVSCKWAIDLQWWEQESLHHWETDRVLTLAQQQQAWGRQTQNKDISWVDEKD